MIIKHKQTKMRKTGENNLMDAITSQILQDGEEIQEDAETLAKQKYDDEAKYTRLHAHFEGIYSLTIFIVEIQKLEEELLVKEAKIREQSRIKLHGKRIQKINKANVCKLFYICYQDILIN